MKINWKQKLSSRKLWLAIAGIISGIALLVQGEIEAGTALIGSSIISYGIAEGYIDGKRAASTAVIVEQVASGIADALKGDEAADIPVNKEGTVS